MITADDKIDQIDYDEDLSVIVVRTEKKTNFEKKLQSKIRTSGCAQGTIYDDMFDKFESIRLPRELKISVSQIISLSKKLIQHRVFI